MPRELDEFADLAKSRCEADPALDAISKELHRIEMQGHRAGWDSRYANVAMFRVGRLDGGDLHTRWCTGFTSLIREKRGQGWSIGQTLHVMASTIDLGRELMGITDSADAVGYGLRAEGWMAPDDGVMPSSNPDREEVRLVFFVSRDGDAWRIMRRRGHLPHVTLVGPNDTGPKIAGDMPTGLKRFVEAALVRDEPERNPLVR